jgi:hypothetical protein
LFQAFRRMRNSPCANAASRTYQCVCRCRGERRLRRRNPLKHHRGLPHENLEDIAFELTVAKRHACKMRLIQHGRRLIRRPYFFHCRHDLLPDRRSLFLAATLHPKEQKPGESPPLQGAGAALFHVVGKQVLSRGNDWRPVCCDLLPYFSAQSQPQSWRQNGGGYGELSVNDD